MPTCNLHDNGYKSVDNGEIDAAAKTHTGVDDEKQNITK